MQTRVDRYTIETAGKALSALAGEGSLEQRVTGAMFHLANGRNQGCPRAVREAIATALALGESSDLVSKSKAICYAIEEVFRNIGPDVPDDSAGADRN